MTCSLTPSDSLIHLMTGDAASAADAFQHETWDDQITT